MNIFRISSFLILSTFLVSVVAFLSDTQKENQFDANPTKLLTVLGLPQVSTDSYLELIDINETEIDTSTLRLLVKEERGSFWAASDSDGNICLLSELKNSETNTPVVGGIACKYPESFYNDAVSLKLESSLHPGIVGHLLPMDVSREAILQSLDDAISGDSGVEVYSVNETSLIVMSIEAAEILGSFEIPRISGGEIIIQPLENKIENVLK